MGSSLSFGKYEGHWEDGINGQPGRWRRDKSEIGLRFAKQFLWNLKFRKAIKRFDCSGCGREKPKGMRYLGEQYFKICHSCALEFISKSMPVGKQIEEALKDSRKLLIKNEKLWDKEALAGSLSST